MISTMELLTCIAIYLAIEIIAMNEVMLLWNFVKKFFNIKEEDE